MTDRENVIDIGRDAVARKACELHESGKPIALAVAQAVNESAITDKASLAKYVQVRLIAFNSERAAKKAFTSGVLNPDDAVKQAIKDFEGPPVFANVRRQLNQLVVLDYIDKNGKSYPKAIEEATGISESIIKSFVSKNSEPPKVLVGGRKLVWIRGGAAKIFYIGTEEQRAPKDALRLSAATAAALDARPTFVIEKGAEHLATEYALKLLEKVPNLYQVGGNLVLLDTSGVEPTRIEVNESIVQDLLTASCCWQRWEKDRLAGNVLADCSPPLNTVRALIARRVYSVPELLGVSTIPFMAPNFEMRTSSGFVPVGTGGYYLHAPRSWDVELDGAPKRADAMAAYKHLHEPFVDFRFEDHELAVAVAIADALSIILRPIIDGPLPATYIEAPRGGAGKDLLTKLISTLILGYSVPAPPLRTTKYGNKVNLDESEIRKELADKVREAPAIIASGNNDHGIGTNTIEQLITEYPKCSFRTLGGHVFEALYRALTIFNANRVDRETPVLMGEMPRRVMRIGLLEPPEERFHFKHGGDGALLAWVRQNHRGFVHDMIVMIKAYFSACDHILGVDDKILSMEPPDGLPHPGSWNSFHQFAELVPRIIMFAGGRNPLEARAQDERDISGIDSLIDALDAARKNRSQSFKAMPSGTTGMLVTDFVNYVTGTESERLAEIRKHFCKWSSVKQIEALVGPTRDARAIMRLSKHLAKFNNRHSLLDDDGRTIVIEKNSSNQNLIGMRTS